MLNLKKYLTYLFLLALMVYFLFFEIVILLNINNA
jgi:hypothetical protein